MTNDKISTKVVTGIVRFSYEHVFEPKAIAEGAAPKYSVSIVIDKDDKTTLDKVKRAIEAAYKEGQYKLKGSSKTIPALSAIKTPLRDGDTERPDDPAYKNKYFINANSPTKPGVVDAACNDILDPSAFYSGCYGRASITFFAYNTNGNRGIAVALNHVQKLKDGERLGGKSSAEEDFGASSDEDILD